VDGDEIMDYLRKVLSAEYFLEKVKSGGNCNDEL
jgi:hypothetical protein